MCHREGVIIKVRDCERVKNVNERKKKKEMKRDLGADEIRERVCAVDMLQLVYHSIVTNVDCTSSSR